MRRDLRTKKGRMAAVREVLDAVAEFDEMMAIGALVERLALKKNVVVIATYKQDEKGRYQKMRRVEL